MYQYLSAAATAGQTETEALTGAITAGEHGRRREACRSPGVVGVFA